MHFISVVYVEASTVHEHFQNISELQEGEGPIDSAMIMKRKKSTSLPFPTPSQWT
jgi:hypothetical protein